jgi:hypothetical protein
MSGDPNAVVRAYGGAASVGHLEIAESVCAAWDGPGDAPGRFARQAASKGFQLDPVAGAWIHDDRAVVAAGVVRAGEANPVDLAWIFLSRAGAEAAWRIEAVTRGASRAGAYLLGWVGARQAVVDLPEGAPPEGEITARGDLQARFEAAQATNPEVRGAHVLPGTARTLVHLDTSEGERWWVLDGTVIVSMAAAPAWEDVLADLPIPWETFERGPGVPIGETAPLSDEARAQLERRVAEVMKPRIEAFVAAALAGRASNT